MASVGQLRYRKEEDGEPICAEDVTTVPVGPTRRRESSESREHLHGSAAGGGTPSPGGRRQHAHGSDRDDSDSGDEGGRCECCLDDETRLAGCAITCVLLLVFAVSVVAVALSLRESSSEALAELPEALANSPVLKRRVVIAALFKDQSRIMVNKMVHQLLQTVSSFEDYLVVLLENDSSSATVSAMKDRCEKLDKLVCVSLKSKDFIKELLPASVDWSEAGASYPFSQQRFSRIAFYRNQVLALVLRLRDFDHFVFADGDLFNLEWLPKLEQLQRGFGLTGEDRCWMPRNETFKIGGTAKAWDPWLVVGMLHRAEKQGLRPSAICAHGSASNRLLMYDMLAFRLGPGTPLPETARLCAPHLARADWNKIFSAPSIFRREADESHLVASIAHFSFNGGPEAMARAEGASGAAAPLPLVSVDSCFGGLSVYSLAALRESQCEYEEDSDDCEHVAFNGCLRAHKPDAIFIDPNALVYYDSASAAAVHRAREEAARPP
jgi:hypothetical protein